MGLVACRLARSTRYVCRVHHACSWGERRLPTLTPSRPRPRGPRAQPSPASSLLLSEPRAARQAGMTPLGHLDAWGLGVVMPSPGVMAAVTTCPSRGRVASEGPGEMALGGSQAQVSGSLW